MRQSISESCPNCNGLGTLDEPHLPGGNCPICRGSGLRDTAPAEEPEAVGLLKRWRAHAGEGFQDVISVRYLTNETDAFLALPAPAEEGWPRGRRFPSGRMP